MTQQQAGPAGSSDLVSDQPVPLARAVLVDEDEVWRTGLRLLLQEAGTARVLHETGDAISADRVVGRHRPELVLLDPCRRTGASDPLEVLQRVVTASPESQVVLMSRSLPEDFVVGAVRMGVRGVVTKGGDAESLLRVVGEALRGRCALDASSTAALVRVVGQPEPDAPPFTRREREVLDLVVGGLPNRLVGRELFITEATVKFHLRNIMDKLGVRRRAEVVSVALRTGLVAPAATATPEQRRPVAARTLPS